jgi:uncharacterized protein
VIQFEQRAQVARRSPNRADVVLFVGAVARRAHAAVDPLTPAARASDALYRWFEAERWTLEANRRERAPLEALLDVPVPIESFTEFDRLFAWESGGAGAGNSPTYLGMAVRAFFEEGGRRCYVVRVCDPWPIGAPAAAAALLVPAQAGRPLGNALDRHSWRGLWHLYGLPEVSFACVPDLPAACAPPPPPPRALPELPAPPEQFIECTNGTLASTPSSFARAFNAPRCDHAGYQRWASSVRAAIEGIERAEPTTTLREVQLLAAVPLPDPVLLPEADRDLLGYLKREHGLDVPTPLGISSQFLQLVYPWVRMVDSERMPEGLASPEGALAGVLACNALTRGTFRSAAGIALRSVLDLEPGLSKSDVTARVQAAQLADASTPTPALDDAEQLARTPLARGTLAARAAENLLRRVTLLGPTPAGMQLLSDVSTSSDASFRQAHLRRLMNAVVRAARVIGEANVFERSAPALWSSIEDQLRRMLRGLWRANALGGSIEADAYGVRCDRSTMSQNDIDNGRVIVEVELAPAQSIERIVVSLLLQGGTVSSTRAA